MLRMGVVVSPCCCSHMIPFHLYNAATEQVVFFSDQADFACTKRGGAGGLQELFSVAGAAARIPGI